MALTVEELQAQRQTSTIGGMFGGFHQLRYNRGASLPVQPSVGIGTEYDPLNLSQASPDSLNPNTQEYAAPATPRLTMRFQPQAELDPKRLQEFQQNNPNVSLQQNPEQITLTLRKGADILQTMKNFINTMFPRPTPEQRPAFDFDGLGLDAYQKASFERQFNDFLEQKFPQPTAAPALSRRQ